jgi:hypothetical protein
MEDDLDPNFQPCPFVDCGEKDTFGYNNGYGFCHSCCSAYPQRTLDLFDWIQGFRIKKTFAWAEEKYPTLKRKKFKWK